MNLKSLTPSNFENPLPPVLTQLVLAAGLGLGIAGVLYACVVLVLIPQDDAIAATEVVQVLTPSETVKRFVTAVVAGDSATVARYASAEYVDEIAIGRFGKSDDADGVVSAMREAIIQRGLLQVEIERLAPLRDGAIVEARIRVFDQVHFAEWAENNAALNSDIEKAVADRAQTLVGPDVEIDPSDRTGNVLIIEEAGGEASDEILARISAITQSYIDDFFDAYGDDAAFMMEDLADAAFLLERQGNRWVIVDGS